jgi:hypothetical protein
LFPEIKPDSVGYLSGSFSKWFNDKRRFLGKLKLTGQEFHSIASGITTVMLFVRQRLALSGFVRLVAGLGIAVVRRLATVRD